MRPRYGTRYFPPTVMFFSCAMMLVQTMISEMASSFSMPLFMAARIQQAQALLGISSLTKLFFFLLFLHGFRLWRLMFKMELEQNSRYEGPALPFFYLLPWSKYFWFTRIVS